MNKFDVGTEEVFFSTLGESVRLSKNQDCIDGGLVYIDENDNVIGVSISGSDEETEFYLASETIREAD